ncbi:AraC family transcriptional regulator [Pacificibacter maritimus]|uniref:AraC family transcriptional regulator n=1 Tax=Pacificibacter maritimus TaxID=762213 RepID=A0A3N4VEL0_9RHOB|nr:helix-turn-helix domain-containing protein [Pacificibacter maritimus]RPE71364.1 AraC family transcriptional regulator [Pacificibacter maritimus]
MSAEFSGKALVDVVSYGENVFLEHHQPEGTSDPYHTHPSIEINYLRGCDMTYSFSGEEVTIVRDRLCVFWAAYPHRPVSVTGKGTITNAYVSLKQFLDWPLSTKFVDQVLSGALLCAKTEKNYDQSLMSRWAREAGEMDPHWQRLHRQEIHARVARLDLEGWDVIANPRSATRHSGMGGNAVTHFDKMLRFIAHNAFDPISVQDVAESAGISRNYAIELFRKMLGVTVKAYIIDLRIHHAKMMLADTNEKILSVAFDCGFTSLSSFYEAFSKSCGQSPAAYRRERQG